MRKIPTKIFNRKPSINLDDLKQLEELVEWCSAYLKIGGDEIKEGITPNQESALHLDLIKDLRPNGKIYVNDKLVYHGKWIY